MLDFSLLGNINNSKKRSNDSSPLRSVRVVSTILTQKDFDDYYTSDLYEKLNEDITLGSIIFSEVKSPKDDPEGKGATGVADPLFPHIKNLPLNKELVFLVTLPAPNLVTDIENQSANTSKFLFYYICPISVWGNINHNAVPEEIYLPETPPSLDSNYANVEGGTPRVVNEEFHEIDLGLTFKEKGNIQHLQPYEGDVIYEGRWGQSLRFSSTAIGTDNLWSDFPDNGDPITILRNGFYNNNKEQFDTIVEDINQDPSSIYLTTTQKLPIKASSKLYSSYRPDIIPTNPEEYTGNQIVITSNRVLINSKEDHVLLSGKKSVGLSSDNSINIDAQTDFIVKTNKGKILLGDMDETKTQSLLLGDKTTDLISNLLLDLQDLCIQLSSLASLPPGTPFLPLNTAAIQLNIKLQNYQSQLPSLLSKISKTK